MKVCIRKRLFIIFILLIAVSKNLIAQSDVIIIEGQVRDAQNKERIANAAITVKGTAVGTVSNTEGEFILKIPKDLNAKYFAVSHISYLTKTISVNEHARTKMTILLEPQIVQLGGVHVLKADPKEVVLKTYEKIKKNYSLNPNMMKGFYRESIRQRRDYISITEAVVDIYKLAYDDSRFDQVSIFKGRKGVNVKKADTLNVMLQGGPAVLLYLDVAKYPEIGIELINWENYHFRFLDFVTIDDKHNYVIEFTPTRKLDYPLYFGKIYIQQDNLAITRAEFSMDISDLEKATRLFIVKKPPGMIFVPTATNYLVTYKEQDGKYFLNYLKIELKFKSDWKRKLFRNNYTVISEMAITDRREVDVAKIPNAERFKPNMIMSREVGAFYDEDFWGKDNIIEPEEAIEKAIRRITKKMEQQ